MTRRWARVACDVAWAAIWAALALVAVLWFTG